ncbi:DUF4192 domain-containing protein [Nonomuraea sp. NPDC050663]|uniref:DUF4192 domain-containing protein n=1 Tax=Nonomuraea sp. NPDC050663 TaxID=3364370 RepID=UPI00378E1802
MTAELVHLRTPVDLLAAIPYMLGFHPADNSLVALGFLRRARPSPECVARYDLPHDSADLPDLAADLCALLHQRNLDVVALVGYGRGEIVTPAFDAVTTRLDAAGIEVLDVLRVEDGRYHSYLCHDPSCCPPEGRPYDTTTTAVAAALVARGRSPLPDRATYIAQLNPVDGADRQKITAATRAVCTEIRQAATPPRSWYRQGKQRVHEALEHDAELSPDQVAWLGALLTAIYIRDAAMALIGPFPEQIHLRLWTQMTRRVDPAFAAAPAAMLAITAWRAGENVLAEAAVDRALSTTPDYSLARLVRTALRLDAHETRTADLASMADTIDICVERKPEGASPVLPEGW